MFGIGMPELMVIFVLALLVFGPKELPRIARTLGKAMAELRRASDELRDGIQREIELAERAEAPPSSPEAVPSTTPAEGAAPLQEAQVTPASSVPAEGSGTPPESIAAGVPTEPTVSVTEAQFSETSPQDTVEPPVTPPRPETDEAKEPPGAAGEHQPEVKTATSTQPVESRSA